MILEIWAAVIWWVGHLLSLANWILRNFYVDCTRAATHKGSTSFSHFHALMQQLWEREAVPITCALPGLHWNPDPEDITEFPGGKRGCPGKATQGPLCPVIAGAGGVPLSVLGEDRGFLQVRKTQREQLPDQALCFLPDMGYSMPGHYIVTDSRNILHNKIISSWDDDRLKEKTTV